MLRTKQLSRKPIYDDPPTTPAPTSQTNSPPSSPTPTDRLATQIRRVRLALHSYAAKTEDAVNDGLTKTLQLENSFTSTVASLAPPKESGEQLLPGVLYVLVSTMAGSIVTRNRNILLRATFPLAVGIGVGYAVLPITMRNVGDLVWTYEERVPAVRDTHLRVKESVTHVWETGKAHSAMGIAMAEEKVQEGVEAVENWVKKGK